MNRSNSVNFSSSILRFELPNTDIFTYPFMFHGYLHFFVFFLRYLIFISHFSCCLINKVESAF